MRFVDNLDGTATLTWDASEETGIHGGFVSTSTLSYDVAVTEYAALGPEITLNGIREYKVSLGVWDHRVSSDIL